MPRSYRTSRQLVALANDIDLYLQSDAPLESHRKDIGLKFQSLIDSLSDESHSLSKRLATEPSSMSMSQYYRNHPDEPISHDWVSGTRTKKIPAQAEPPENSGNVLSGNADWATISSPPEQCSDNKRKA